MFKAMKTSAIAHDGPTKVLLYAHHGFGKTYQCRYYQKRYGKGLILSGESGLKSVEDVDIDYVPFDSWDGTHDPDNGKYSFRGIIRMMSTSDFKDAGYNWIAIDSITEMSERLIEHLEAEHAGNILPWSISFRTTSIQRWWPVPSRPATNKSFGRGVSIVEAIFFATNGFL